MKSRRIATYLFRFCRIVAVWGGGFLWVGCEVWEFWLWARFIFCGLYVIVVEV
jgi:hypothetical protein